MFAFPPRTPPQPRSPIGLNSMPDCAPILGNLKRKCIIFFIHVCSEPKFTGWGRHQTDPSISWGATACSGSHPARVVFRRLIVLVLETICQITRGVFNGCVIAEHVHERICSGTPRWRTCRWRTHEMQHHSAAPNSLRCGHGVLNYLLIAGTSTCAFEHSSSFSSAKLCCE